MIPAAGLLGMLAKRRLALGVAGLEYPLHGLLGEAIKSTYKDALVPDTEEGYIVRGRPLNKDKYPIMEQLESLGYFTPTLHHYQFVGNNGKNRGFAPEGEFSERDSDLQEYSLGTPFGNVRYDAKIVDKGIKERQKDIDAIRDLKRENPELYGDLEDADLGDYEALLNNCHDYISDVLWRGIGHSGR